MIKSRVGLVLIAMCVGLQGCQSLKTTLGIERQPPDEFAVLPNSQPLDMPPDFRELPLPRPGTPRPQEVKAMEKRKHQSFGGDKSPQKKASSPGQNALLKLGGIDHREGNIRNIVDGEHDKQTAKERNVLRETLGISESHKDALDPKAEVKKLKEQGISPGYKGENPVKEEGEDK